MHKTDMVDKISSSAGISKESAAKALDVLLDVVTSALSRGQKVSFVGFGNFHVSRRKARIGRNPRTGESIAIAAARVPRFTAGKSLRDAVNR